MEKHRSNLTISAVAAAAFAGIFCISCEDSSPVSPALKNSYAPDAGQTEMPDPDLRQHWNRPRTDERLSDRARMVQWIRESYDLRDPAVLEAMQNVPRHWFVPPDQQPAAYIDSPLPIGHGQTISQPFIVAYMTGVLDLDPNDRVLEIGTGSGYQAAVLNEFTPHVYTIEIVEPLGKRAMEIFNEKGYNTIRVKVGDGYKGWPQYAPFDAVIVTCAPNDIPPPLLEQLKPGGRMIIPVGGRWSLQELILVEKDRYGDVTKRSVMPVRFVPLVREKD